MKKLFTLILLTLISMIAFGQNKKQPYLDSTKYWFANYKMSTIGTTDTSKLLSSFNRLLINTSYKPLDTVKCYLNIMDTITHVPVWKSGYVILINGGLKVGSYIYFDGRRNMLVGPFDNIFLAPDCKNIIFGDILQVYINKTP